MNNELFSALQQYGFKPVNDSFCVGTWRNYAVALQKFGGKLYYAYLAVRFDQVPKGLKKTLNNEIRQPGLKLGGVERVMKNFIHMSLSFPKSMDPTVFFAERMDAITGALGRNGVAPANSCAVTGAASPDSLCLIMDPNCFGYQPVCGSAVRQSGYEAQAKVEDNENNGSYLTGLLGAVLGMLVGVGVNLLTMVFLKHYYVALFALVPIAAMVGYKLFKGRTDKISIVIIIVLSVIAVPLMEFLFLAIDLSREYDAPLGECMKLVKELFFEPEVTKETVPEMLKMLLFMALGVGISWGFISKRLNSTQVRSSKLQLDSMQPNPLYQAPQQVPQPVDPQ